MQSVDGRWELWVECGRTICIEKKHVWERREKQVLKANWQLDFLSALHDLHRHFYCGVVAQLAPLAEGLAVSWRFGWSGFVGG